MQAIRCAPGRPRAGALLAAAAIVLCASSVVPAGASAADDAATAKPRPIPSTGWHGRPIERPAEPVDETQMTVSLPASWEAGAVGYGTGYHRPHGSRRVREVQRRLHRLGYRTGPIDGLYGPLTRSAVQWFQIKHGLQPTGFVAATTLAVLRNPGAFADKAGAQAKTEVQPAQPSFHSVSQAGDGLPAWLGPLGLALLGVVVLLGLAMMFGLRWFARSRGQRRPGRPGRRRREADRLVIGYVSSEEPLSVEPHAEMIYQACLDRGWLLAHIVHDRKDADVPALNRPGLTRTLRRLKAGGASRLVVHRLEHLAGSMPELQAVLAWLVRTRVPLTALDAGIDSDTPSGRARVRAILTAREGSAQWPRRIGDGRGELMPGTARAIDREDLSRRIHEMRDGGMTLQAIADQLNEERVPTARGGREWRRSSVNSLLGYRHPRAGVRG